MRTKDLVLSALFASSWVASQYYLGPIVGRFSLGPISFHGSVNRIVGWLCMTVLSSLTDAFGPVSLMSAIAAVATRPLRAQQLEGLSVGLGYFLGGLSYETLILRSRDHARWHLVVALLSGLIANIPYTLLKLYFLGPEGFLIFAPLYSVSVIRTTLFSVLGASAGLMLLESLSAILQVREKPLDAYEPGGGRCLNTECPSPSSRARDPVYQCSSLGVDPFGLACGCSVKVDLEEVVYPALKKVSVELASLGVRFNRRDDVDIMEDVGANDVHLMRAVYRIGSGQLEAQELKAVSPSRVVALFSVEQRTGSDVDMFSMRLLDAYSALARSVGPIFVGKAHSILGARSPENEVAVFDLISTRGVSEGNYVLANNCTIRTVDPTRDPSDYFQVAIALGNSLNDLFCNGVHRRITISPVFDMPGEELRSKVVYNIRKYCEEYGFDLQLEQGLGLGEVMIGATVTGESERRPPDFGPEVAPGDLVLITRPLGELAILNLHLALNIIGDDFVEGLGVSAESVREWRDEVVKLITKPNLEAARIISRYLPRSWEKFDPDLHIKESTDISGPGVFALDELAKASGFSISVESIPLLNKELVELSVELGLMTNGTSGTNGAIAVIGSPKVVTSLQEELSKAGYEPSVIGRVKDRGETGLKVGRGVARSLISSGSGRPSTWRM